MSNIKVIRPQKGPQEKFLSTTADIAIYGGAAGGGKSYGLLIEPLRYKNNKRFGAVIFRHEYKQIFNQGGLWDTSNTFSSRQKKQSAGTVQRGWGHSRSTGKCEW